MPLGIIMSSGVNLNNDYSHDTGTQGEAVEASFLTAQRPKRSMFLPQQATHSISTFVTIMTGVHTLPYF